MTAIQFGVYAAATYFGVFGLAFVVRPSLVQQFGLTWDSGAGKTEIRCYYGAVSIGLAAFLLYLVHEGLERAALTGVLLLASTVLTMRVVGTAIDGDWRHIYTRTALPIEAAFVLALALVRFA